jgi:plastocyanin domain-containing protein
MTALDWMVVFTGLALMVAVNWWFLGESAAGAATSSGRGIQEARILVQGGYQPSTIRLKAGQKARLVFDRQETAGCSEEIVFPSLGIKRFLPAHEQTAIELKPLEPGQYDFTCGMSMLHGKLIVEE